MSARLKQLLDQVQKEKNVFIAESARVLGNVHLEEGASVWYGAVIRADHDTIRIGKNTNVQDNSVMHVDPGFPIKVGENNVIGHSAILHGCTIGNNNLIGMRATIMNGAVIGNGCIIGAHALVTENTIIPDYSMVLGVPGKVVKTLDPSIVDEINKGVDAYLHEAATYLKEE